MEEDTSPKHYSEIMDGAFHRIYIGDGESFVYYSNGRYYDRALNPIPKPKETKDDKANTNRL